jgi:predicted dehydrogenase
MSRLSRRRFLQHAATGISAAAFAGTVAADEKKAPPNERLRLAVIGVAGRGADNLSGVAHEEIVALCDVDEERAGKARQAHPRAKFYQDFRKLFDSEKFDAVVISTPDHMHAIPAVMAMRAGKHVYCEKPLAHSVHEVRVMRETAAKHKVVTQMGTQIHAGDNYRRVVEIVRAGVIGPVSRVHVWCSRRPDVRHLNRFTPKLGSSGFDLDVWVGPAPKHRYDPAYIPFHWRWFWDFGGGILADMACHYMDLAHWALDLGAPAHVEANGKKDSQGDQEAPDLLRVDYRHPARGERPAVHLTWYNGVPGPSLDTVSPFEGFKDGVLFEGAKGKLLADYGRHKLFPEADFRGFAPPPRSIAASIGHHREWLTAIRTGGPTTCNFAYSGTLAETVLLGNVAYRSHCAFDWDEQAGKPSVAKAATFLQREYRKGWSL